jgi:hypothetical protein
MGDRLAFYQAVFDGEPALISVDDRIGAAFDEYDAPFRLRVRLIYRSPDDAGFPDEREYAATNEFELRLEAVADELESAYVGRILSAGHCDFFVYVGSETHEPWRAALQPSLAAGLVLEFEVERDEEHAFYFDVLLPAEDEIVDPKDVLLLDRLAELGDDGSAVRQVDHFAFLPSFDAACEFANFADANGYVVDPEFRVQGEAHEVAFTHEGPVDLESIRPRIVALRRKAAELGGEYDGWGCNAVTAEPPPTGS